MTEPRKSGGFSNVGFGCGCVAVGMLGVPLIIASLVYLFQPREGVSMRTFETSIEAAQKNVGGECQVTTGSEEGELIYCRKWRGFWELQGDLLGFYGMALLCAAVVLCVMALCYAIIRAIFCVISAILPDSAAGQRNRKPIDQSKNQRDDSGPG